MNISRIKGPKNIFDGTMHGLYLLIKKKRHGNNVYSFDNIFTEGPRYLREHNYLATSQDIIHILCQKPFR